MIRVCSDCQDYPIYMSWITGWISLTLVAFAVGIFVGRVLRESASAARIVGGVLLVAVAPASWAAWYFFADTPMFVLPWIALTGVFVQIRSRFRK